MILTKVKFDIVINGIICNKAQKMAANVPRACGVARKGYKINRDKKVFPARAMCDHANAMLFAKVSFM